MRNKPLVAIVSVSTLLLLFSACTKSEADAAREKQRLDLEEQAQRDVKKANKAITDMTDRAFRKRTPEEEEKAKAEKAKRVQELIDAQKKAEAEAKSAQTTPKS